MIGFENRRDNLYSDLDRNFSLLDSRGDLDEKDVTRIKRIKRYWDFFDGYHWEGLGEQDGAELTVNYIRAFIDKFTSFELGKSFTITTCKNIEGKKFTKDNKSLFEYLEQVWKDNDRSKFLSEYGYTKNVTGDVWIQVRYISPEDLKDPYNLYPDGQIKVMVMQPHIIFDEYDPLNKDILTRVTIKYQFERVERSAILGKKTKKRIIYQQIWTDDEVVTLENEKEISRAVNKYGVIPFVHVKNLEVPIRTTGRSDLEDIIPLNAELDMKQSDISEIIDYHQAPVTIVYGAKIGNLEKGANKVWGGLPKDARVENLSSLGDVGASSSYINAVKKQMCEVAGIPETVLGGAQSISNTSGVALEYMNLPLIEKTRMKRQNTIAGLEEVNRLIILVSMLEGLITKPADVKNQDLFHIEVKVPNTLPKDMLIELQQIQLEMQLGLEDRQGAFNRLGKENYEEYVKRIDEDRKNNPELYGIKDGKQEEQKMLNSGIMNGSTPIEQVRKENNGVNKPVTE